MAAAAWHAEPLLRFLSTALGGRVAGVWVNEDGFIAVTAELSAVVEASIAVGPEGELRVHGQHRDTHLPCTAPDLRSFERALEERLGGVGVPASGQQPGTLADTGVIPAPTTRRARYPGAETGCGVQGCRWSLAPRGSVKWRMIGPSGTVADQP